MRRVRADMLAQQRLSCHSKIVQEWTVIKLFHGLDGGATVFGEIVSDSEEKQRKQYGLWSFLLQATLPMPLLSKDTH